MRFIRWDRLQWVPPMWGVVGAIIFLLVPLRYEMSFFTSAAFVFVGGGLLLFIAKLPLTYTRESSANLERKALRPVCIE
jgi:hypothetical protein